MARGARRYQVEGSWDDRVKAAARKIRLNVGMAGYDEFTVVDGGVSVLKLRFDGEGPQHGKVFTVEGVQRLRVTNVTECATDAEIAPQQGKQEILDAIHKLDEASFEYRDHFKDVIPALYEKYVGFGGEGESRSIQDRLVELGVDQLTALRDEIAEELRDYGASLLEQKVEGKKARARKDPSVLTPMQLVAVAALQSTGPATAAQIASAMGMEGQAVKVSGVLSSAVEKGRLTTTKVKGRAVYHLVEWNLQSGAKEE